MTRKEAQDYDGRVRQMLAENFENVLGLLDMEKIRRFLICEDYKTRTSGQIIRMHSTPKKKLTRPLIHRYCGRKNVHKCVNTTSED